MLPTPRGAALGLALLSAALLLRWALLPPAPPLAPGFSRSAPGHKWTGELLQRRVCSQAQQLRVCSHRADATELGAGLASEAALAALWDDGVSCFDVDVVATSDGELLVAHPSRLAALLAAGGAPPGAQAEPAAFTAAQLAGWGASAAAVPRLGEFMRAFGRLLRLHGGRPPPGYVPHVATEPAVLLDLKGAAFSPEAAAAAVRAAREAGVLRHTVIWVMDGDPKAGEVEEAVRAASTSVGLIRGYRDRQELPGGPVVVPPARINAATRDGYQAVGPALRVADHFFLDAKAAMLPAFVWVVDDYLSLQRAVQVGSTVAISNRPVALQRALTEWHAACDSQPHS
eukprot:jgi/Tetstr1/423257/TSEL_013957.t1